MGIDSPADRAAAKLRPSFVKAARATASGVLLAALAYPAFAATPTTSKAQIIKMSAAVSAKRLEVAGSPVASRVQGYLGGKLTQPTRLPVGAAKDQRVTVVVRLSGAPVAALRAQRLDHKITQAEHAAIHQQVDAEQAGIEPSIVARGGRVVARYRDALNGIKIQINRSELEGLSSMPGVLDVLPVATYHMTNTESVPFIGAPQVWNGVPGYKGEGVKIAIIDTGIDYTHANFGGPGTVAAFEAATASGTGPADPTLFGPNALKVKGGIDLSGDDYDATDPTSVPQPDPNPLDCNGHGSHTAGTAAGFGVGADGTTYFGPYSPTAYTKEKFIIGPGVAPTAALYAVRVFGCAGSTNLVVDAIDWSIDNDMDVISMSLGADFGPVDTADAIAVANATKAGILVAAASGNAGPAPYLSSTPASGTGGISVAAMDSHANFPGASIKLTNGTVQAIDANGQPLPGSVGVVVLRDGSGNVSLGCDESEYVDSKIKGKLVVTLRGTCARVLRPELGQKHGAAAVAMINSSPGFPPYEGPIPGVTIPFLGILMSDAATVAAATSVTKFTANTIANPTFKLAAGFSSGGPRFGDSALRPNITAPGVSIFSTAVGTGNGGLYESGTSMATPHVAGVAALVREAHPNWTVDEQRAAVVGTADPKQLLDYAPRIEGAGLVQPLAATTTDAVVVNGSGTSRGLFFGFEEFAKDYKATRTVALRNFSKSRMDFKVTTRAVGGSPHTAKLSRTSVTVDGKETENVDLTLSVPVATVGSTHAADGSDAFQEVAGYVTFTPTGGANNGVVLNVPYYLVPRSRSNLSGVLAQQPNKKNPVQKLTLTNNGAIGTNADFYAWGLNSKPQGMKYFDTRAVGVQSNPISATDSVLIFAINTFQRFSSAAAAEFDLFIDTDGDGVADYLLAGIDQGSFEAGASNGIPITVLVNLGTGDVLEEFLVDAPTDGSTVLLPVLASDMGISPSKPRFSYTEQTTNFIDGSQTQMPGTASFNAFAPSITNALFVPVAKGKSVDVKIAVDFTESKKTPAFGLMIMATDNFSGARQADLIQVNR